MLLEQLLDSKDDFLSLVNNNWRAFLTGWQIIMQRSCRHHKTRVSYGSIPIPRLVPRALNVTVLSRMIGGSMWQKSLAAPLALLEASVTLLPFCFLGVCGLFPVHLTSLNLSFLLSFYFPNAMRETTLPGDGDARKEFTARIWFTWFTWPKHSRDLNQNLVSLRHSHLDKRLLTSSPPKSMGLLQINCFCSSTTIQSWFQECHWWRMWQCMLFNWTVKSHNFFIVDATICPQS